MKYTTCDRCHVSARSITNQIKSVRLEGYSPRDLCRDCVTLVAAVFDETLKKPKMQTWIPDPTPCSPCGCPRDEDCNCG